MLTYVYNFIAMTFNLIPHDFSNTLVIIRRFYFPLVNIIFHSKSLKIVNKYNDKKIHYKYLHVFIANVHLMFLIYSFTLH